MSEVEMDTQQELPMSSEDKFFGVKTQIGKKSSESVEEQSDFELEVIDERPEEDRRPPKAEAADTSVDVDDDDEELAGYEKVQKRINKLRYEQHEERRKREAAAERMREEAVRVAEQLNKRNQENEALINRGEAALVAQIKAKAELALQDARNSYKQAYEEGDTDRLISAQESLNRAQAEYGEAERYENNLASNQAQREQQAEAWHQQQIAQQAAQNVAQQAQPEPQVSPEAEEWAGRNSWFMQEGYEEMTSLAYGTHAALIKRGIQPNSAEYFDRLIRA